jgi:hypothetical protein
MAGNRGESQKHHGPQHGVLAVITPFRLVVVVVVVVPAPPPTPPTGLKPAFASLVLDDTPGPVVLVTAPPTRLPSELVATRR